VVEPQVRRRHRNPHLFLTKHTGRRTEECSKRWIWLTIGPDLSIAAIREDRILDEAHTTGGDVRRLADLFGLSIQAGTRYTNVISHLDLSGNDQSRPVTTEIRRHRRILAGKMPCVPVDPIPDKELSHRPSDDPVTALPLRHSPGPVNCTAVFDVLRPSRRGRLATTGRRGCARSCPGYTSIPACAT
jgi:hypothetical protein